MITAFFMMLIISIAAKVQDLPSLLAMTIFFSSFFGVMLSLLFILSGINYFMQHNTEKDD